MEILKYTMLYFVRKNTEEIRILGKDFVKSNSNKGKIIIENKKIALMSIIPLDKNEEDGCLKINMILDNDIYNKSSMFKDCVNLLEVTIEDYLDNKYNIEDQDDFCDNQFFYEEESLFDYVTYPDDYLYSSYYEKLNYYPKIYSEINETEKDDSEKITLSYFYNKLSNIKKNYVLLNEMFFN